ncbi:hypothetical protein [Oceanobacillus timonensis]|uniref:hypothetical protein n=1 Tax=Oceanobacillus timonensis TaxID=1926285 RepID=UPI0009BBC841|nr:hypothetical protein [Oceanobacillus timonensis]
MSSRDLSNSNVNLSEEIHLLITSNYEEFVDPLYERNSEFIIESIILYLEQIYGQKINKNTAIQEIINLFMYFSKHNYTGTFFWEKIKKETGYKCISIDMLSEKAKNNLFGYVSVSITSGLIDGVIIEEKNFIPKISCEVFFENENNSGDIVKVTNCTFNNFILEMNIEVPKELFHKLDGEIQKKCLSYAYDVLEKFGQNKELELNKFFPDENDMTVFCVYLIK